MGRDRNILVVTQWNFNDPLIQTYTLPYVKIFSQYFKSTTLVCLNPTLKVRNEFTVNGVKVIELPFQAITSSNFLKIYFSLSKLVSQLSITHLHSWCTTAGSFGYLLKKFYGKNLHLVIDSFEPHAEAMVENGEWSANSIKFKFLFYLEKLQAKNANTLIFAADGMQEYIKSKYNHIATNFYVKPACVDFTLFNSTNTKNTLLLNELSLCNKIVAVYAGKFGGIYLDKEVFEFIKQCIKHWGDSFRFLLLSNIADEELSSWLKTYSIEPKYVVKKFVPHAQVANYIGLADFALTPVKPVPTKRYCTPIKNGEYWAMGLPIVITNNISTDSEIIKSNAIGSVFTDLSITSYQKSVIEIDKLLNQESKQDLSDRIKIVANSYRNFDIAIKVYKSIYLTNNSVN